MAGRVVFSAIILTLVAPAALAAGDPDTSVPQTLSAAEMGDHGIQVASAPPPPPPAQAAPPPAPPPQQYYYKRTRSQSRHEFALNIGIPVWFTTPKGLVKPGFAVEGRYGWVMGALVPEFSFGWQTNRIDSSLTQGYRLDVSAFWFSLGLRLQWLNKSIITPFISGAFHFSFWHRTGDTGVGCGYYWCYTTYNYDFSPGFSGKVGASFQFNRSFAMELGARVAHVFPVAFSRAEAWVTPYIGFVFKGP